MLSSQHWSLTPHDAFFHRFDLFFFFAKMGRGPFCCARNHCVVSQVRCCANKRNPQKMRGAPRHAKGLETNNVTSLIGHVVLTTLVPGASYCHFWPVSIFYGNMGRGPFRWSRNHCVVPHVSFWANKRLPEWLRGAPQHANGLGTKSVTGLGMLSSQHWSLKPHNVIFAPFSLLFSGNGPRAFPLGREPLCGPARELANKQTSTTKAERFPTT